MQAKFDGFVLALWEKGCFFGFNVLGWKTYVCLVVHWREKDKTGDRNQHCFGVHILRFLKERASDWRSQEVMYKEINHLLILNTYPQLPGQAHITTLTELPHQNEVFLVCLSCRVHHHIKTTENLCRVCFERESWKAEGIFIDSCQR